jgi:hypothetical protein
VKSKLHILNALFIFSLLLSGCNSNRFNIDITDVKLNLDFINLDSLIKKSNEKELTKIRDEFRKEKSDIFDYNVGYCLRINLNNDTALLNGKNRFYKNDYINELEINITKANILNTERKKNIIEAFKRLKKLIPKGKMPKSIYQINSSFSSSIFSTEKEIAIGIERYLGTENKMIKKLPSQEFYAWIKESMRPEYLERDILAAWLMTNYLEETTENYASEMIRWGKILFITELCLSNTEKRLILRYNQAQFKWAENSTESIWKYLVKNEILFKIDEETRMNLLKEGPYTIGLPEESPDRIGQYMGYKIVSNYMNSSDITLEKLIKIPYNEILQKYKLD